MVDFPYAPEDIAVELYMNGTWNDLVSAGRIKLDDGVRIQRGKSSSTTGFSPASPSSCTFTIKNSDGAYSPDNPLSTYYKKLVRGTPVRVACRVAEDTFTRTTSNGLGTADRGGVWSLSTTASRYATAGSAATISFATANNTAYAYQGSQLYASHDVAVTFTFPFSNVTGAGVSAAVILGWVSDTDYFVARLNISAAEVMTLDVTHIGTGDTITSATTVSSFAFTGQAIRMRAQLAGQTIRTRVWLAASAEPADWLTEDSYAFDELLDRAKGSAGFRVNVNASNTNVPFSVTVDDWEVRSNRYAGSITTLEIQTDVTGKEINTYVECGGPRRRLGQGSSPVDSPLKHAQSSFTTTLFSLTGSSPHLQYFPCEDAAGSTQFASGLTDAPDAMIVASGTPQFATDSSFPGSLPIAKPNVSRWFGPRVVGASATGEAQLLFCMTVPQAGEVDAATLAQIQLSGTAGFVDIVYGTASSGRLYLVFYDQGRAAVHTSSSLITGLNGTSGMFSVELTQDGADIDYRADGLQVGQLSAGGSPGTCTGRTIGTVRGVYATPYAQVTACSLGHIALRNDILSNGVLTFLTPLNGYSFPDTPTFEIFTEATFQRIERMCAENEVPFTFIRRPNIETDWTDVGTQPVATALSIIDESVAADLATLYEDRDIEGFVYRYGRSRWNQDAVLTVDIASGQLAPPFKIPKDDQALLNDVEVKRKDGSAVRVTDDDSIAVASRYDTSVTLNLWSDTQLADRAYWLLHVGTADDPRYPSMELNLARAARDSTQLYLDMLAVDIDDRVVADNPNALVLGADLDLLAVGYAEVLAGKAHTLTLACTPGGPYAVAEAAGTTGDTNTWLCRIDTDSSSVTGTSVAGVTTLKVKTPSGPLWTTTADDFPLYLNVGGIQVRATACSGSTNPQTFTVDALPTSRTTGDDVSVWHLPVLGF
ncbi:hypothetical protein [Amycolatopsis sp. WQ 127309]|uniref:hypothetical protein n=1 Tax=Amycolatopsis sp. WQ 127309 TaxID=2932773 RepID=UPI001FF57ECC|nr:hypothetical protein [Amycolatopsis sp. WQ 127309]UOZ10550.1 hypothetical protein MUY22_20705 [Amycolatopsis sp. WQ 127309]